MERTTHGILRPKIDSKRSWWSPWLPGSQFKWVAILSVRVSGPACVTFPMFSIWSPWIIKRNHCKINLICRMFLCRTACFCVSQDSRFLLPSFKGELFMFWTVFHSFRSSLHNWGWLIERWGQSPQLFYSETHFGGYYELPCITKPQLPRITWRKGSFWLIEFSFELKVKYFIFSQPLLLTLGFDI